MLILIAVLTLIGLGLAAFLRWDVSDRRDLCLDCQHGVEHPEHPKESE